MPKTRPATSVAVQNLAQTLTPEQQKRTLFAIVASGYRMADGTAQDVARAMVRFRDGSLHYVFDLPPIDKNDPQPNGDYVLPLVNDHAGEVSHQAGACWLFIGNDNLLHALIVFSTNGAAADAEPLARDGFIQFSTEGLCSEIGADGVYGDFWITAVAPVTVGNDPATQVVDNSIAQRIALFERRLNSLEAIMPELTPEPIPQPEGAPQTPEPNLQPEGEPQTPEPNPQPEGEPQVTNDDDAGLETPAETEAPMPAPISPVAPVAAPATAPVGTTPIVPAANAMPVAPSQTFVVNEGPGAGAELMAYANALKGALRSNGGQQAVAQFMNAWRKENAITGDATLPATLVSTFFKAWLDNENLAFVRFMNAKAGAVYAMSTTDTAKGHLKGATKVEQTLDQTRRDLRAIAMYKKLSIDRQDIFDDENGNLVQFRAQELASRLTNQQLVAILLGGTQEGSVLSPAGAGARGLWGILDDAAAAVDTFGSLVASTVAGIAADDAYAAVLKTVGSIVTTAGGNVTTTGRTSNGVTLFVPWSQGGNSWITKLLLTKTADGNQYMFTPQNLETLLRVSRIVEVPELAASGKIIAVADGAYQMYGESNPSMYPFFDTNDNTDKLLAEQFVAGSLAGYKQAAVYTPFVV